MWAACHLRRGAGRRSISRPCTTAAARLPPQLHRGREGEGGRRGSRCAQWGDRSRLPFAVRVSAGQRSRRRQPDRRRSLSGRSSVRSPSVRSRVRSPSGRFSVRFPSVRSPGVRFLSVRSRSRSVRCGRGGGGQLAGDGGVARRALRAQLVEGQRGGIGGVERRGRHGARARCWRGRRGGRGSARERGRGRRLAPDGRACLTVDRARADDRAGPRAPTHKQARRGRAWLGRAARTCRACSRRSTGCPTSTSGEASSARACRACSPRRPL
mmetsp:Transcript_38928/g.96509  ORF Transcript_38928/g.96509 Transcript_38928/m.96509 type:complete len:269 (+) Transcript_38928:952-1758(+)